MVAVVGLYLTILLVIFACVCFILTRLVSRESDGLCPAISIFQDQLKNIETTLHVNEQASFIFFIK